MMNGEAISFADANLDAVYAYGVLQYTFAPQAMIAEIYRVLRPSGQTIFMVYNRIFWLNALPNLFVGTFNLLPKAIKRPPVWHLMAFAYK